MLRTLGIYGVLAGVIVGTPLFIMTVTNQQNHMPYGMVVGYLIMLVALSVIVVAVKRQRDKVGGGVINFWPAFGMGVGITVIAGLFYVGAWEAAQAVTHMDFPAEYGRVMLEQQKAKGASAEELAALAKSMDDFRVAYANPLYRLPMTFAEIFPVGVLVSLIAALLFRNPRFLPARQG